MDRTAKIVLSIVALLVVAAAGFVAGDYFDLIFPQPQAEAFFTVDQATGGSGEGGMIFRGQGGDALAGRRAGATGVMGAGMVFGEIRSIENGLMTMEDMDGNQRQVKVTDTTLIEKNMSVDVADLAEGETVIVSGSQGDDGIITARSIQVAPAGRMGFGQPGAQPGAQPGTPQGQ